MTKRTLLGIARSIVPSLLAACGGHVVPDAPVVTSPQISVDTSTCETALETVAQVDWSLTAAFAATPDGTVYLSAFQPAEAAGVYAIAPGAAPMRISSDVVPQLLVDDAGLLLVSPNGIRRLPFSGGTLVPLVTTVFPERLTLARLDPVTRDIFFSVVSDSAARTFDVRSVSRKWGFIVDVLSLDRASYREGTLVLDGDVLLLDGEQSGIYRAPKTGGAPALVRKDSSSMLLAAASGEVFSYGFYDGLRRGTADPNAATTPIALPQVSSVSVGTHGIGFAVSDADAAYFAFDQFDGASQRTVYARLPLGDEPAMAAGCSAPHTSVQSEERPSALALSATHVYALLDRAGPRGSRVVRMPR